jgi:hypothetical protein
MLGYQNAAPPGNPSHHLRGEPSNSSLALPSKPTNAGEQTTSPSGRHKHSIDLTGDDLPTNSNKKQKASLWIVTCPHVFRDVVIADKSGKTHSLYFYPQYLVKLQQASKPDVLSPALLLGDKTAFRMPSTCARGSFHPLHGLVANIHNDHVSGTRLLLSIDQNGVEAWVLDGCRIHKVSSPSISLSQSKLPGTEFLYFDHAAWFIECTNLHATKKEMFWPGHSGRHQ